MTFYTNVDSPLGPLRLVSNGTALVALYMDGQAHALAIGADWTLDDTAAPFPAARQQLKAYFACELSVFDLPLAPKGTEFQCRVWQALQAIPFGVTTTYGELAQSINKPTAARAVGLANGRNPIGIVIPCHRVIGRNGKLVGYDGGLARKAALLALESKQLELGLS
jgi:methylated-DNA-[protein]-cysteine S-methyltransferase